MTIVEVSKALAGRADPISHQAAKMLLALDRMSCAASTLLIAESLQRLSHGRLGKASMQLAIDGLRQSANALDAVLDEH